MAKFKKGDKVRFNGSINEMYTEDFDKETIYTVQDPSYKMVWDSGTAIRVSCDKTKYMVWMREGNFDLDMHMNKYKEGDSVVVTGKDSLLGDHCFIIGEVITIIDATLHREGLTDGVRTEYYYAVSTTRPDESWYVHDGELAEYVEPKDEDENDSQVGNRKLLVASFVDRKGNEITIKRSKCRHYYLKKTGKPMKRIAKRKIGAILGELASTL